MTKTKKKYYLPPAGKCFDHLGGGLAPLLFERLIEMEWIKPKEGRKKFKEVFDINTDTLLNEK